MQDQAETQEGATMKDWDPGAYARFRDLRLRPALDLLARVPSDLPDGALVDLGCGEGAAGPALAARWPGRKLLGIDASPAMLERAAATGAYDRCQIDDIARWQPRKPPALIFSNAVLHWLPDHARLLPDLAAMVAPGGVLALQVPRQFDAPSHRLAREIAADMFAGRFPASSPPPVASPAVYHRLLSPLGLVSLWETEYLQRLIPDGLGHPVRRFTEATTLRPILTRLDTGETREFLERYDAAMARAYPFEPDGAVLLPFRRLFLVLQLPGAVALG